MVSKVMAAPKVVKKDVAMAEVVNLPACAEGKRRNRARTSPF
jgi:hypothetical protein